MEKRPPRYIAIQSLVGIWKLVEARAFDDAGHEVPSPLGPEPMGGLMVVHPLSRLLDRSAGLEFAFERVG